MRRRQGFDLRPLGLTVAFAIPGASLTAAGALATDRFVSSLTHGSTWFPALVLELGLACLAGAGVYLAWSRILRLPELAIATDLVKRMLRRS